LLNFIVNDPLKERTMKNALLLVGIIMIAAAAVWKIAAAPRFDVRFPDGWKWSLTTFGTNLYADEKTGQFPDSKKFPTDDDVNVSDRMITVSRQNTSSGLVRLDDHYLAKDPNTGAITWDFTYHADVDPRNVQKGTTYRVRNTSYPGLPVTFQQETTVNGLAVYELAYVGDYNNAAAYPETKLAEGQTIKCTNFDLRYWVEPLTGEVVKYTEHCNADAVVDVASGKALNYLSRWSGETQSNSIIARVSEVSVQRNTYLWLTSYGPMLLGIFGVALLGAGALLMSRRAPMNMVPQAA
jgi:hypothetical protein